MAVLAKRVGIAAALWLVVSSALALDFGDAWNWPLAPRRFGLMSQTERTQYTRAEDLLRTGNYDAAAVEFEKFIAQNPRSEVRSHALLLQAYSLHLAKQRNQAIRLYTELLDFYRETADDAAPAAYLKGNAQIQNGNVAEGMTTLRDLVEDDRLVQHPIGDLALNQLAEYALAHDDAKKAERYWVRTIDLFEKAFFRPENAAVTARKRLAAMFIRERRMDALDGLLERKTPDAGDAHENVVYAYDTALPLMRSLDDDAKQTFLRWFRSRRDVFLEDAGTGEYLDHVLRLAHAAGDRRVWQDMAADALDFASGLDMKGRADACPWISERLGEATRSKWKVDDLWKRFADMTLSTGEALPAEQAVTMYSQVLAPLTFAKEPGTEVARFWDVIVARAADLYAEMLNPERDAGLASLVDRLARVEQYTRAFDMAARIENPALAQWKRVELYGKQEKYAEMAEACEELEGMDTGTYAAKALRTRADLYKDRLRRYEDAVKLYAMINDPPGTIWKTSECYEKLGKPDSAVAALSEIESFFERDAARAAYRKALIWQRAGNKEKAVAAARAVLKKYPRDAMSSQAHQMLERYGIKTGGGVLEVE